MGNRARRYLARWGLCTLTPAFSETRGSHLHSHIDNHGQSQDAVVATEQTESHVIGSFRSTIFIDSQLESAGTGGGQPLSSCFSEQFAYHFPNFTLQLLLSSHCLNYLLLHKEWHFLGLRNSLPHTTLAAMCLTKGRVVANSLVLADPLKRHQASARDHYWQIGPIAMALPADCVRLSVHYTASLQLNGTNGATKPTRTFCSIQ